MHGAADELLTIRDWLRWAVSQFNEAGLVFGHGTDNATDEAAWMILAALHLPRDRLEPFLDARLTHAERLRLLDLLQRRIAHRLPTAYLVREAWLGDYRFYIDQRAIVPRSFFAGLLAEGFAPWIADPLAVGRALDLCTGSGCLAILMAEAFPAAAVDAVDLSPDALAVAERNVADYGLGSRVRLVESDLFSALGRQRYDLIISNPPYVTAEAMDALPPEYRHEPALALGAGEDGLDIVRRILAGAGSRLNPGGLLAIEVGRNRPLVDAAFPDLALTWLDTADATDAIFLVRAEDLPPPGNRR